MLVCGIFTVFARNHSCFITSHATLRPTLSGLFITHGCNHVFQSSSAAINPAEPPQNTIKSQLKRAIKAQAIDEALQYLPQYVTYRWRF